MICSNSQCTCLHSNINFWNGTFCEATKTYQETCAIAEACNSDQNLQCNFTGQGPYKCVCPPYYYWDSVNRTCRMQKENSSVCSQSYECLDGTNLYCSYQGFCVCPWNQYWSTVEKTCCKFEFF